MKSNTAAKFLPIFSDEQKVEVSLDGDQAVIRLSTWTEDLGWCCQKTMALDAEILDDLHRVISAARYRLNKQKGDNAEKADLNSGNVISFPKIS